MIGSDGAIAAEAAKTVEEMRMQKERGKFAAGKKAENLDTSAKVMEDQYTKEELGAMMQKSKKHRRKRKKEKRLTDTDLDALEKAAPQKGPPSSAGAAAPSRARAETTASQQPAPSIREIKESRGHGNGAGRDGPSGGLRCGSAPGEGFRPTAGPGAARKGIGAGSVEPPDVRRRGVHRNHGIRQHHEAQHRAEEGGGAA